jgi:hypothetical protein
MALYKLANTYVDPGQSQTGFATPGAGAQYSGERGMPNPEPTALQTKRPAKGLRSWLNPGGARGGQQGFAPPDDALQMRPDGSMPNVPPIFGGTGMLYTPPYSRGAAAFVPQTGKLLTNPIGAGIVAQHRPQASYGSAAQYANGALWWTSQVIPTSLGLQGLDSPELLAAQLGMLQVQAVVRTTG